MVITGQNGNYEIVRKLGGSKCINYHICRNKADEWLILAIAAMAEHNAVIDRTEYLLSRLFDYSEKYEREFAKQAQPGRRIHYDWLFPQVVEQLTLPEQGERRVNILHFPEVDLRQAFALMQITEKGQRVDLKTSAWIMGRLLKLLSFLHESSVTTPVLTNNFLIEPDNHRLLMLDWSEATIGDTPTPAQQCFAIKQAAECVLLLLGATCKDGVWHYDYELEENENRYIRRLQTMHKGEYTSAYQAHAAFYETVDSLWGRQFHPFTTYKTKMIKEG